MALPLSTIAGIETEQRAPEAPRSEVGEIVQQAFDLVGPEARSGGRESASGVRISIDSEVPIGVGLGSSAALTVAIMRAVYRFFRASDGADTTLIWRGAHELERRFHGTPSGIDTGLATFGGVQAFRRSENPGDSSNRGLPAVEALRRPEVSLVVATIPRRRSTGELVAQVRRQLEEEPESTGTALDRLGRAAADAMRILRPQPGPGDRLSGAGGRIPGGSGNDAGPIGRLADEAQRNLRTIGVSSDTVEESLEVLQRSGAIGGKLSGAGGGGALFGVYESAAAADRGRTALRRYFESRFAGPNYRIWVMESANESITIH
jgi:mevalonate kinase